MEGRRRGHVRARVRVVDQGVARLRPDLLAVEEPLELRLRVDGVTYPLTVTMRTPGHDFDLAAGFLYSEGIVASGVDIREMSYCVDAATCDATESQEYNVVTVDLRPSAAFDPARLLDRAFGVTSACGVCGKASLDLIERRGIAALPPGPVVAHDVITALPGKLREAQGLFEKTGGLHAAARFTAAGDLVTLREDVGRHNAVDKLAGRALLDGKLPMNDAIVMVSGRSSFEIAQKCAAAGVPILCAVSAPSSLAVDLARRFGMTLIGFLREDRFNIYSGAERIALNG